MAAAALPSREREALLRVVAASASAPDLAGVLELAASEAREAVGAASLSISRFEDEGRLYRTLINVGQLGPGEVRFPESEVYEVSQFPRLEEMVRTGSPYFSTVDDPNTDPPTVDLLRRLGKSSDLGVAIEIEGRRWGGIWATTVAGGDSFRAEDLQFLEAVAGQIAAAIARAEMFSQVSRLAYEDALTGLANRRAVEERLERAFVRYGDGQVALSLLLCDVDRLKAINDAHGHAAGDTALRRVADALVRSAADYPGAFVGRIGGDEFCVLLESRPDEESEASDGSTLIADLGATAQRLLADHEARSEVTFSCGAASAGERVTNASELLDAADAAQYVAKRRGGNRICTTAHVAEEREGDNPSARGGTSRERLWATAVEVSRTLDGELAAAPVLDRLEVVARGFTTAGDFARWAISFVSNGETQLRDVSLGDNRERRWAGARVAQGYAQYEQYELDQFPVTARIVAIGSGSFVSEVDDPEGDPAEQGILTREGFHGVVGAVAGDSSGVYLVEIVADDPGAPLSDVEVPLRLAVRAAIPPQGHRPEGGSLDPRHSQVLDLSVAVADRLADASSEQAVCDAVVEELQSSFDVAVVEVVAAEGGQFVSRAALGVIPFDPEWRQGADSGLMGRSLSEGRPVLSGDVTREPGYRTNDSGPGIHSELAVPISAAGRDWGVINLEDVKPNAFDDDDVRMLESVAAQLGGAINAISLFERLDRAYLGTAEALSAALEARDSYTAEHSRSITSNAAAVGRAFGMQPEELRMLRYAAAFHDIGKLAVPQEILNKPGPLTPEERLQVEGHTPIGERILAPIDFLAPIRPWVLHAHERWDGGGYPDGLAGEAIPLQSRILFACDAYDAMTTVRPYRKALPQEVAMAELQAGAGGQFDPAVVEKLLAVLGETD